MFTYKDIGKDVPSLSYLSTNDIHQFLIVDLAWVLRNAIQDYVIAYDKNTADICTKEFVQELKMFWRSFVSFFNKIYEKQSPALHTIDRKNFWFLPYLVRNEITRQAFQEYVDHVHEK